jgi:hypothetical protein
MRRTSNMKSTVVAFVFLVGVLVLSSSADSQQDDSRPKHIDVGARPGHLPKAHYIPTRQEMKFPVWVDASLVFNSDGSINTDLVHPEGVKEIQALRGRSLINGCTPEGPFFEDIVNLPPRATPEEATKTAQLVLLGKVTETAYGLFVLEPGQLLRIVPQEIIKGQPRDVDAYFVFFPVAEFMLGGIKICKTDNRYPAAPAVGDQVLLFLPPGAESQTEPYLELDDDGGIITLHANGVVSLPKRYRGRSSSTSIGGDELLARVRAVAAGDRH